ncbi:MAG: stage II sporulation protein P [Clostridia bacterium]|nr:stage II sporulation protein P [Clostridia bacterium]
MFLGKRKLSLYKFGKKRSKLYFTMGIGLLFIFGLFIANVMKDPAVTVSAGGEEIQDSNQILVEMAKIFTLLDIDLLKMQEILGEGCPLVYNQQEMGYSSGISGQKIVLLALNYITGLNTGDPMTIFQSQFALLTGNEVALAAQSDDRYWTSNEIHEEDFYLDTPPGMDDWQFEIDPDQPVELTKDPVVLVYNTHNAETYQPTDGKAKLEGKNAGVAKVAQVLAEELQEKYGLKTIRSETIHDYPDWSRSYINSMQTVQALLKANKTIRAVFDVHRDAGFKSKETTTVKIAGKNAASLIIVIGTEHNRWRENLAFAEKLEAKANELYPGLIRDIRIAENRRYNQHLHPGSMILEFGCDLNTLEEAQYSARLFAKVVAEVIKGIT